MTLYAHVNGSTVDTVSALPALYFDGTEWHDWRGDPPWRTEPGDVGWFPIALAPRPADTATDTYVEEVVPVNGIPVQTWTSRPWTVEELAARQAAATTDALTDPTALQGRLTRLAAYKTDTDLTAVLAQTNNQALPTATLNRALKTMVRRDERLTATLALLVRLLDPALLVDVTDITDS